MTLHDKYSDLLLLVLLYKITIVNNLEMERSVLLLLLVVLLDKITIVNNLEMQRYVLALLLLFQTGIYSASICWSSGYK
jgi:hypothetical protein